MAGERLRFETSTPCGTCGHAGTEHYRMPYPSEDAGYETNSCLVEECECEWYLEPRDRRKETTHG